MFLKIIVAIISNLLLKTASAQPITDSFMSELLMADTNSVFRTVISDPAAYRVQIIYTQIDRDKNNIPSFRNYYFNVDEQCYFNPASTVKLPLALLALEKLNSLHIKGVNKYASLQIDSNYSNQTKVYSDSTSENYLPSIAHYIKKVFLISDNDAYNRLYEFIGQGIINKMLQEKGYTNVRITRRFTGMNEDENRHTNAIRFLDSNNNLLYTQEPAYNKDSFDYSHIIKIGKAYYNRDDSLINEPIDFTKANNLPLAYLQQMLQYALFPGSTGQKKRFQLAKDDYAFLYKYLSQFASETSYPKYDTVQYYDNYVKFFFRDETHKLPDGVRVFNKVGWAYGFLTDVSYVADFKNNIEFMLTATIYVNSDGILNDDKYDYETTGYPFMLYLGRLIYTYDLHRHRNIIPDLGNFKIKYDKRDINDNRPSVKDADN